MNDAAKKKQIFVDLFLCMLTKISHFKTKGDDTSNKED